MAQISVIVPVFNAEKYIKRCIDSILSQTFTDFELILIDDGSTDKSGEICDTYKTNDSRIIVIHQKNKGQANARNVALDWIAVHSKSCWISFIDSDDFVHPKMFETLINIFHASGADIVLFDYIEDNNRNHDWNESNNLYRLKNGKKLLRERVLNNQKGCWVLWDKMYRRSCFKERRLPEMSSNEENALVNKILYYSKNVAVTDNVLYFYYSNENSITRQPFSEKKLDWLTALDELIMFYEENQELEISDCLIKRFLKSAPYRYQRVMNEFPQSERLVNVKRRIRYYYKKKKEDFGYSYRKNPLIFCVLHPNCYRLYHKCLSLKNRHKISENHYDT